MELNFTFKHYNCPCWNCGGPTMACFNFQSQICFCDNMQFAACPDISCISQVYVKCRLLKKIKSKQQSVILKKLLKRIDRVVTFSFTV